MWDERPLYGERIEAWANGPVVPVLYNLHRGQFLVHDWPHGRTAELDDAARATIDRVLAFYGDKTPQWLSDLSHAEKPWRAARDRVGAAPGERCSAEITLADMAEFYGSL